MQGEILKFKDLIDRFSFAIACPPGDCTNMDTAAYRWVRSPIDKVLDFLPNHLYGEKMNIPPRKNMTAEETCNRCAISLFTNENTAHNTFKSLPPSIQSKIGYTHVAIGSIEKSDGLAGEVSSNGHFNFYEYEASAIVEKFTVKSSL